METLGLISLAFLSGFDWDDLTYRLARCAVKCVSDCKWAGKAGREGWACAGVVLLSEGSAMMTAQSGLSSVKSTEDLV